MKITNIRLYQFQILHRQLLFVAVDTDSGIIGLGEATLREKTDAVAACVRQAGSGCAINPRLMWSRCFIICSPLIAGGVVSS